MLDEPPQTDSGDDEDERYTHCEAHYETEVGGMVHVAIALVGFRRSDCGRPESDDLSHMYCRLRAVASSCDALMCDCSLR